jgi:hypothetical protein
MHGTGVKIKVSFVSYNPVYRTF